MCICLKRHYQSCGHDLEKIVRCALPYYWLNNRVDDYTLQPDPAEFFDKKVNADDPDPTPFFGCFDCLDEFEEVYSIGCPDCTGQGSVHSQADLISRVDVKNGKESPEAYELMKQNYHRYLIDFLQHWPRHQAFFHQITLSWHARSAQGENSEPNVPPPDNALYQQIILEDGPNLWSGPEAFLLNVMDKILAEVKCRQETTHPPPDRYLEWDEKETHLAEHFPALNNTSTALRRRMALDLEFSLRNWLKMILIPQDAEDVDDEGNSAEYEEQPFINETYGYHSYMSAFRSENIAGPRNPGKGPYDILEFVPQMDRWVVTRRMEQMKAELIKEMTRAEIKAPKGDDSILGGRTRDEYERNEQFIDKTLDFIFQLLAFDSGLTGDRMMEIARMFFSLLMEPWYEVYGHPGRMIGQLPQGHEAANFELRSAVIELDEASEGINLRETQRNFVDRWWQRLSYDAVMDKEAIDQTNDLSYLNVYRSASNHWLPFYNGWLQILANVELSHTKLTQEQLDAGNEQSCPICADDYDVSNKFNCPVYYGCTNNHVLCKKCYTALSLVPTRPYNRLQTDRFCPTCRALIPYKEAMNTNLLGRMRFMPTLSCDLARDSFTS